LFNVPQKMLVKDVFPNPTNQTLTWDIESESIKEANISIMDVTGRIVFNRQEQLIKGTQRLTFDIADLQSGLYSIALSYDNQVQYSQKFVKSN
jgi:hypothetical protein